MVHKYCFRVVWCHMCFVRERDGLQADRSHRGRPRKVQEEDERGRNFGEGGGGGQSGARSAVAFLHGVCRFQYISSIIYLLVSMETHY